MAPSQRTVRLYRRVLRGIQRRLWWAWVLPVLLLGIPSSARSQERGDVSDRWLTLSVGAGALRFTCDYCATGRDLGPSVRLGFGAYARPDLGIGIEVGGWSHDDDGIRENVFEAGVVGQLYPRSGSGLHVLGGLGWVGYRADSFAYDAVRLSLGAGWDFPLSGRWVVGNEITVDAASFGALRNGDRTAANQVSLSVLRLSILLKRR